MKTKYTYLIETCDDGEKYFVIFIDVNGQRIVQETDREVFAAMKNSDKSISSQKRSDKRHLDKNEIKDKNQNRISRSFATDSLEDNFISKMKNSDLKRALELYLTITERRRIIKYFWKRMTVEEIASEENCTHQAVSKCIRKALHKMARKMDEQKYIL